MVEKNYDPDNDNCPEKDTVENLLKSKMDSEKYYHTLDDEIETLDMNNMAEIIKAIAISSSSIVAGKDTPSRVDTTELK